MPQSLKVCSFNLGGCADRTLTDGATVQDDARVRGLDQESHNHIGSDPVFATYYLGTFGNVTFPL